MSSPIGRKNDAKFREEKSKIGKADDKFGGEKRNRKKKPN